MQTIRHRFTCARQRRCWRNFHTSGKKKRMRLSSRTPMKIADMCEKISPVRPDKCPPVIEHSDQILRSLCYEKAHEIYGETLPPVVEERLERELNSIISNGFAVMYIIAQKLVWKSNAGWLSGWLTWLGWLVLCRDDVRYHGGESAAALIIICPHCHYSDFDSEDVKKFCWYVPAAICRIRSVRYAARS